jgi:RimJ/RimL family protein N-acetyltransferase
MTDPNFYFETPNLYISYMLPTEENCEFLVKLFNTPEFIAAEGKTGINTVEKARKQIESYIPTHERVGHGIYLVTLKDSNAPFPAGTLIGQASFMQGDPAKNEHWCSIPDIGWVILPEFTKKGYATEVGKALVKYSKDVLGKTELFAFTMEENKASRRVCEKVGFEFRGVMPILLFGGDMQCVYALPGTKDLEAYMMSKE